MLRLCRAPLTRSGVPRRLGRALVGPLLVALAAAPAALPAEEGAAGPEARSDAELERAWGFLTDAERRDAVDYLRLQVSWLDTFQASLVGYVLGSQEVDPGTWPEAAPAPWFDPVVHAPKDPIPRRRLSPDSRAAERERELFFANVPERNYDSAFAYDYATRGLVRTGDPDDPERVFRNALRGGHPDQGLVEALVERALDDGSQRVLLAAFGHAYTDRSGNVYPGLTLYDAWCSGRTMEMPDVDNLGVVHTVLDEWRRWTAPVPDRQHDALYEAVGELFGDARRHRGLRHALARCYLAGTPVLRDGYEANLEHLHSLWDHHASTPAELAAELPEVDDWAKFLDGWLKRCYRDPELAAAGKNRRATLDQDGRRVRDCLARVLADLGAFERRSRPAEPAKATAKDDARGGAPVRKR